MQRLEFLISHNRKLILDELQIALPTFERVKVDADGGKDALPENGRVSGLDGRLIIEFADDIDPADIQAVVDAHDPSLLSAGEIVQVKRSEAKQRAITAILASRDASPWGQILYDLAVGQGWIEAE